MGVALCLLGPGFLQEFDDLIAALLPGDGKRRASIEARTVYIQTWLGQEQSDDLYKALSARNM